MKRKILITLATGILCLTGFSQIPDKTKLDNYFDTLEAHNKFMGSVAVSQNGIIVYSKSIGFADVENQLPANENTKYRIGSISKTFTTVLVFKAIEEKKLSLDQTLDQFFPAIQHSEKITIKMLLSHRSGIHNFTNDTDYLTWNTQAKTEKEMVDLIAQKGSDFEPDSKAAYSNSNFVLLTYILEKTFKKPYAELLTRYITKPIGLTNTYYGGKIDIQNKECYSYRFAESWEPEPETDLSIPMGAGGIVSTSTDLVKFSDALFGGKLLKKESLELMKTVKDGFGSGLIQLPFYGRISYGHTGGIDGFSSVFGYFADGNISYAMTSNGSNFNNNGVSMAVLSAVYDLPYDIPEFTTYVVHPEELDQYAGIYSSQQLPLKISITKDDNKLIAQATGQPSFPLSASGKDKFVFDQAGIVMEFNPSEKTMLLKQGGGQFLFTKE
ncbi:MAG TPA: serine hydrolase domain-containing protein [Bacteroidales bacterium]|nr:serine hydrolase domain-containing protein [Bacteroidales bacterium]HPS73617.1 serine hydrolase domain-containing protein [Bacteroidales bacterium]